MPHIAHMIVALLTATIFFCVTALMVVASSDLNPVSIAYLASPVTVVRLKILVAKAAFVIAANDFQGWPKPQAICMVLCVALICWWNFRRVRLVGYCAYLRVGLGWWTLHCASRCEEVVC